MDIGIDDDIPVFGIWYLMNECLEMYFMNVLVYDIWCLETFGNEFNECIHWESYSMMVICLLYDIGIDDVIPVVGIWYLMFWKCI